MATDIIARGMAAGAAKSVSQIREELKSKSDKSWTGTKAEWETLDKSILENGQQINITDDAEPIEIQQIAAQVAQDKTAAETAAATCESISEMMSSYTSPLYIKPTVEGDNIMIEDGGNAPIQGLTVYGKSTQGGTPIPDNPVDIISVDNPTITVTDNGDNTQSATIPYTLRGIPVSSGGNYTDSTGQQWVCDTLTVNADGSGMLTQRVGNVTAVPDKNLQNIYFIMTLTLGGKKSTIAVSTKFAQKSANACYESEMCCVLTNPNTLYLRSNTWNPNKDKTLDDVGEVSAIYQLATPVTITLSPSEVQSILALQTYKPLTNISNDKSADMSVTYVADSKTYIDNKFAELSAAIISSASEEE